ncbi:uncharacterized protein DEA37_0014898 [Paragonimus westermani]|uniref:Uncharacterized protein n=1 Tax=Paragonimus westermani TaxID=34504 RepID=A0A5J4P3E3_9TREM|nr:uncharacterized protein DEA37_0014898 [Paragonimus westermani]
MESPFANIRKLLEDPRGFSLSRLKAEAENINLKDKKPVIDVALRSRMLHLLSSHSLEDAKVLLKMGVAAALASVYALCDIWIMLTCYLDIATQCIRM